MYPTPRTDAEEKRQRDLYTQEMECGWPSFPADFDFARMLECEVTAANARAEKWEKVADMFRIPLFEGAANTYAAIAAYAAAKEGK